MRVYFDAAKLAIGKDGFCDEYFASVHVGLGHYLPASYDVRGKTLDEIRRDAGIAYLTDRRSRPAR